MFFLLVIFFLLFVKCMCPANNSSVEAARYVEQVFCLPPSEIELAAKESEQLSESSESDESNSDESNESNESNTENISESEESLNTDISNGTSGDNAELEKKTN